LTLYPLPLPPLPHPLIRRVCGGGGEEGQGVRYQAKGRAKIKKFVRGRGVKLIFFGF